MASNTATVATLQQLPGRERGAATDAGHQPGAGLREGLEPTNSTVHTCCSCIDSVKELLKTILRRRSEARQAGRRRRRQGRPTPPTSPLPPIARSSAINIVQRTGTDNAATTIFRPGSPDPSTWLWTSHGGDHPRAAYQAKAPSADYREQPDAYNGFLHPVGENSS